MRLRLSCATLVLLALSAGGGPVVPRAEPHPEPQQAVVLSQATRAPRPRTATVADVLTPVRYDRIALFGGLGAWIDLYDYDELALRPTIERMARSGVRTLYVQTGWPSTEQHVVPEAGPWLAAAHEAGIKVVGWYLPHYADVERDVRRTVAIARYRYRGHRFDGLGIDVEFRAAVPNQARWMARVAEHARAVRERLPTYPIASIPPTPLQMAVAPSYWEGFPWAEIGAASDAIMLMSYWSDRDGCGDDKPHHCPYPFTKRNVELARALSGVPHMPVHVIGGVGDAITRSELRDFVRAALDAGADGASIYDVGTTRPGWWSMLEPLRRLGTLRRLTDGAVASRP